MNNFCIQMMKKRHRKEQVMSVLQREIKVIYNVYVNISVYSYYLHYSWQ